MDSLEEWSNAIIPTHPTAKIFPSLEKMEIDELPNLSVFQNFGSLPCLKGLILKVCHNLSLSPSWNSLISHKFKADDERVTLLYSAFEAEETSSCPDFVNIIPDIHYLQYLCQLCIIDCEKFVAPFCSLKILTSLKSLRIRCNPSFWPKDLHHLTSLELLDLDGYPTEIDCFPWPYSISFATHSLTSLTLRGWRELTSLLDQIQFVTTLERLEIQNFDGLEALSEWLGNLECFKDLEILSCAKLKQFPSVEAFQRLTNLHNLYV